MKHFIFFFFFLFFIGIVTLRAQTVTCDEVEALHPQRQYNDLYLSGGLEHGKAPRFISLDFCEAAIASQVVKIWFPSSVAGVGFEVDFHDGNGFQAITSAGPYEVRLPNPSNVEDYSLQVQHVADSFLYTSGSIQVKHSTGTYASPNLSSRVPGPISVGGGVQMYVKYKDANAGLVKPFIIVVGLDLENRVYFDGDDPVRIGGNGWDHFVNGADNSYREPDETEAFAQYPAAFDAILGAGYDLIIVDFLDGTDRIQSNGLRLIEVLRQLKQMKRPDIHGNTNPGVLCGASMGGQVARWALATMEAQNEDHCIHTYISFDSPQKGANMPLAFQSLALLNHLLDPGQDPENDLWVKLNSPAARQMLIEQLSSAVAADRVEAIWAEDSWPGPCPATLQHSKDELLAAMDFPPAQADRDAYVAEMDALGYPKKTRNVAIACGSNQGQGQGFGAGDVMLNAYRWENTPLGAGNVAIVTLAALNGIPQPVHQTVLHVCSVEDLCAYEDHYLSGPGAVFRGVLPFGFTTLLGLETPCMYNYLTVSVPEGSPYPTYDNAPGAYRSDLRTAATQFKGVGAEVTNKKNFNFIPGLSALDLNWPVTTQNLFRSIDNDSVVAQRETPFSMVYSPKKNLKHVELDGGMISFILEQSALGEAALTPRQLANQTVIYGDRTDRVPKTEVFGGGVLGVNIPGITVDGTPAVLPSFSATLNGMCDLPANVDVYSGGELRIGDTEKIGFLHVPSGQAVHIYNGGVLHIRNASSLVIEPGGSLILERGAMVHLESYESSVQIFGNLHIEGDIRFKGAGYFHFLRGNALTIGNATDALRLAGRGKGARFIRIEATAELLIPNGKGLDLSNGGVEHEGERLRLGGSGHVRLVNVDMVGGGAVGIEGTAPGNITITNCLFDGLQRVMDVSGATGALNQMRVRGTEFRNFGDGPYLSNRRLISFYSCTFEDWRGYALKSESNTTVDFTGSYMYGSGEPSGVVLDGGNLFSMTGGLISNCDIGITNQEAPSNILMWDRAEINGCRLGIWMTGNATKGSVTMACSKLIENRVGIRGTDILLMVDGNLVGSPNEFVLGYKGGLIGNYFEICYSAQTPPNPVPASFNFWGINQGGPVVVHPTPAANVSLSAGTSCSAAIGIDTGNPLTEQHEECQFQQRPGSASAVLICPVLSPNGAPGELTLHDLFQQAAGEIALEEFEEAYFTFDALLALAGQSGNGFSEACQLLIDVSQSIVGGLAPRSVAQPATGSPDLKVYPNPTSGMVQVQLPEGTHSIRIWDALGRLVKTQKIYGSTQIDVRGLAPGVYHVEAVELGQSVRLVVQF